MLNCPEHWPPQCPPWPEPPWFRRMTSLPAVGTLLAWSLGRWLRFNHELECLYRAENGVFDQIRARRQRRTSPESKPQTEALTALAEAVASEKGIPDPIIELDDEVRWLLWGAYDDLTPALLQLNLKRRGYRLDLKDLDSFCAKPLTVHDLLSYVARQNAASAGTEQNSCEGPGRP